MYKRQVVNPSGLHLRPAGVLSQTAMKFKCDIIIECGEKRIVAKSVLNVMAAGIKCGTEINLICDGEDEEAAMEMCIRDRTWAEFWNSTRGRPEKT